MLFFARIPCTVTHPVFAVMLPEEGCRAIARASGIDLDYFSDTSSYPILETLGEWDPEGLRHRDDIDETEAHTYLPWEDGGPRSRKCFTTHRALSLLSRESLALLADAAGTVADRHGITMTVGDFDTAWRVAEELAGWDRSRVHVKDGTVTLDW